MVGVKDLLRLVEVDVLCLCLLPGQVCHEVQVVIQQTVFGAVLALLLEAGEHLAALLAGKLVEGRIMQALFQLLQIGDVLGVQFVQFILQIFELLLDGCFAIELLVVFLLGGAHLIAHLHELKVFIDHLLHQLKAPRLAVLGEHGIALLALAGHPG